MYIQGIDPPPPRPWGIDLTFYWLTDKITYLRSWENTRAKKLANSVLPVCRLSYFAGKPKESAAWAPEVTTY